MEKLPTESKSIVEQAVAQAVKKIKHWTRKEIFTLIDIQKKQDRRPLIVPIGANLFLVGNYAVRQIDNHWHMIYRYNDDELVFTNRHAAMFYAICNQTQRWQIADQLLNYDQHINRLIVEEGRLKTRLLSAGNKKNYTLKDHYYNRYQETLAQLSQNRMLLEKTLKLAKYCNH